MQTPTQRLEAAYTDLLELREPDECDPIDALTKDFKWVVSQIVATASPNPLIYENPIEDDKRVPLPPYLMQFLGQHKARFSFIPARVLVAIEHRVNEAVKERLRTCNPADVPEPFTGLDRLMAVANNFGPKYGNEEWLQMYINGFGPEFLNSRLPLVDSLSCGAIFPRVQGDLVDAFHSAVNELGLEEELKRLQNDPSRAKKSDELNSLLFPVLLLLLEKGYSLSPVLAS